MILAPLRGVTIRTFRETFAAVIREVGFTEAFTPFLPAMAGVDPLKDRELRSVGRDDPIAPPVWSRVPRDRPLKITPQFIGKDPQALTACLKRVKDAGYDTADLNCGCPFPMVRNKGRGSGLLKTPETLERMLAAGCETMGPGRFSIKARLGVDRPDELLRLMPIINAYPLRFLTVHGRIARQMYEGEVNRAAMDEIVRTAQMSVVLNGDLPLPTPLSNSHSHSNSIMIGRAFIRSLGERKDIGDYLREYIAISRDELYGERPVLGRIKELLAYWKDSPRWVRRWQIIKICRSVDEILTQI